MGTLQLKGISCKLSTGWEERPLVSVILPVYNEENIIYLTAAKIIAILSKSSIDHEIIMVNDGSTDHSGQELQRIATHFSNVSLISLSRNFGKEAAISAGLEFAQGSACIVLDADLQHPPEIIPEMVRLWRDEGYEVVEAVKSERGKESPLDKLAALTFYKLFHKASGIDLRRASDFKLLDRKVVDSWKQMHESITFFRGMSAWLGYKRTQVPFIVQDRKNGSTKWSTRQLFKYAVASITSYTSLPLFIITWLGIALLCGDLFLTTQTLYMKYAGGAFTGFTTVIILLLGMGSMVMISLGVIGIYIAKIYEEVKHRPRYFVSSVFKGAKVTKGVDHCTNAAMQQPKAVVQSKWYLN